MAPSLIKKLEFQVHYVHPHSSVLRYSRTVVKYIIQIGLLLEHWRHFNLLNFDLIHHPFLEIFYLKKLNALLSLVLFNEQCQMFSKEWLLCIISLSVPKWSYQLEVIWIKNGSGTINESAPIEVRDKMSHPRVMT